MTGKKAWSNMAKRTACIMTVLCVSAASVVPQMGTYTEVFAAEESTEGLTEGLTAYLQFDDSLAANSVSDSSLSITAQGNGVTKKENEGVSGSAAYFDGKSGSSIKLASAVNAAADDITLMAWIKCDSDMFSGTTDKKYLFQQTGTGRSILYLDSNMKLGTFLTASDSLSEKSVSGGKWTHVVFTSNHATKKAQFYIDGKLVNENSMSGDFVNAMTDLLIGNHKNATATTGFKGYMDEVRYYKKVLTQEQVKSIYDLHSAKATPNVDIKVDTSDELREISRAMFGINHRYHNNGYSSWNATEKKIEDKFNTYVKEAKFGSIRYPGGTVSNLFDWKRSIGPAEKRKKTVHGLPETSDPITPNFGLDEAMTWIYDDIGAEAVWVYGMGQGSAADAADLFEYLNAPADGDATNPNGGVDWAEVRAKNGHPEPYGVTRFEIGNEIGYYRQTYWMDGRASGTNWMDTYIDGGRMSFDKNTRTVQEEDWRDVATNSDGTANQVHYVRYAPAVEGSVSVYVGGTQWQIVASLEGQGAKNVCTVDETTGKITFGDGTNGNIPQSGQAITAAYQSDRDGFKAYYQAMKQIAEQLHMDIQVYCGSGEQVSFVKKMAAKDYNKYYDGVVIHPYSDTNGGVIADNDPEFYEKVLGRSQQHNMSRVKNLVDAMNQYAPGMGKVPVLSEFGVYNHNTQFVRAIGHAVYIANEMIDYIGFGTPYINKHCLVDYPYGADNLGSGSQCVIQAIKQNNGTTDFVSTPSAKMFSIFNNMTGTTQVRQTIEGNSTYYTYKTYGVPLVKAISSKDEEGNTYITVVNNSKDDVTNINLALDGRDLTGKEIQVWYLTSKSVLDENTQADPDKVKVQKTNVSATEETMKYTLAPHSITAFKIAKDGEVVPPTESCTVSVTAEAGGKVSGGGTVEKGKETTVTATADEGYKFEGWYKGTEKVSDKAQYKFTVTENVELTAKFEKEVVPPTESFTVSVRAEAGGKVSGGGTVEKGKETTVTATADEGYKFEGWYKGTEKVSDKAQYKFTVTENVELTAKFEIEKVTPPGGNESGSTKDTDKVTPGTTTPGTTPGTTTPETPAASNVAKPKTAKNVKAKATKKGIQIKWKKVSGANGYYIYRSTKKNKGYKKIHTVTKGKTQSYVDKKARKGKTYYYKIKTYKKVNGRKVTSNWSKVVKKKY